MSVKPNTKNLKPTPTNLGMAKMEKKEMKSGKCQITFKRNYLKYRDR